jgi:hypothetical protein
MYVHARTRECGRIDDDGGDVGQVVPCIGMRYKDAVPVNMDGWW